MFSVHQLRKMGYKVRVQHDKDYILHSMYTPDIRCKGHTCVEVTTPDGHFGVGNSYVLLQDQYNRKLGVKVALGRALKRLGIARNNKRNV
jgi:hypothetical protein